MKKHLVILFVAVVLFIAGIVGKTDTAYAAKRCNLQFIVTDDTKDGYPGSEILAVLTDSEKKINDEYLLTYADSWGYGEAPYYTVKAPALYEITFEGLENGYRVVDSADPEKKITLNVMPGDEVECRWSIVESEETGEGKTGTEPEKRTENSRFEFTEADTDANGIDKEEADKVFQEFLEAVAFTENDEDWNEDVFIIYDLFDDTYVERYEKYVKGGTEEEFMSMSLYERFIWNESYLVFAWTADGNYNGAYGSEEGFKLWITDTAINLIEDEPGWKKVEKAYLKLAKWQYDCVHKTGSPYNFINKRSYVEETSDSITPKPDLEDFDEKTEDEELKEAAEELLEDSDESLESVKDAFEDEEETGRILDEKNEDYEPIEEEGKKNIWGRVIDSAGKNIIPIVIVVVLGIALIIVIIKRKSLNINDDKDSGNSVDSTQDK